MFERFTDRARRVLAYAQEEARLLGHGFVGTEHILLGLIREGEGLAARVLDSLGVSLDDARTEVGKIRHPSRPGAPATAPFTPRAKKVLELALRESLSLGHNYIGTEHLLLGVVREGEGAAAQVLRGLGHEPADARQRVLDLCADSAIDVHEGSSPREVRIALGGSGLLATGQRSARVGRRMVAEVVVAGRDPQSFAIAYESLSELARTSGLESLDRVSVLVSSVMTVEGPGLRLTFNHELDPGPGDADSSSSEERPSPRRGDDGDDGGAR